MNYFAHGFRFLDDPFFLAGTALPDWLSVVNRQWRFRAPQLRSQLLGLGPTATERFARGVLQHLEDDSNFHKSPAFSAALVEVLRFTRPHVNGCGIPPVFLSHLLVEVLLDATLLSQRPGGAEHYYRTLDEVDPEWIERSTGELLGRSTPGVATFVRLFRKEEILYDYADDAATWRRINQVMTRLRLPQLPSAFREILPAVRAVVASFADALLQSLDGEQQSWQNEKSQ